MFPFFRPSEGKRVPPGMPPNFTPQKGQGKKLGPPPRPPQGPGPGGPGGFGGFGGPGQGPGPGGFGGPGQGPGPGGFGSPVQGQDPGGPSVLAVDPGAIRPCVNQFVYIWPDRGQGFWAYITFVGPRSIAGYRFRGRRFQYFGLDLRRIDEFYCA